MFRIDRRGDHTYVDMTGTHLMPDVSGRAKIINKRCVSDVHVDVENLRPANALNAAYLTYVLWAVSPEGVPKNMAVDQTSLATETPKVWTV